DILNVPGNVFFKTDLSVGDTTIIYDDSSKRWFLSALSNGGVLPSFIFLAVSDGKNEGTITADTQWFTYQFDQSLIPEGVGPNTRNGCGCLGQGGDFGQTLDFLKLAVDYSEPFCQDRFFSDFKVKVKSYRLLRDSLGVVV